MSLLTKIDIIPFHEYRFYQLALKDWYDYCIAPDKLVAIALFKKFLPKELSRYDLKKYVSKFEMRDKSSWK